MLRFSIFASMQAKTLDTKIEFIKGVGPKRAEVLKSEANIYTLWDLINYMPFRYVDRTVFHRISELRTDMPSVQIKGQITHVEEVGSGRGKRLVALFEDGTGSIELVWFKGIQWIKPGLKLGVAYICYGKVTIFNRRNNIAHPELEMFNEANEENLPRFQAVYPSGEKLGSLGLNAKGFNKIMNNAIPLIKGLVHEIIPMSIMVRLKLMPREESYKNIHFPSSPDAMQRARYRLKFEELFFMQLQMLTQKIIVQKKIAGYKFTSVGDNFNNFYRNYLPFELTNAQKRVIKEIRKDTGSGVQMNRLLQGDVGSGKTIVALLSMLIALDNNFQACIMAPTEILAQQHFNNISSLLKDMPVSIWLLTGSTPVAERKEKLPELSDGNLQIVIGTHALLEDPVVFKNLGIVIVDEQHRFGVQQRARMWKKNNPPPHILVMTATPIPRTLAMTFYGDLDVSVIDEMPPGRKAVKTVHKFENHRLQLTRFLSTEIEKGRQVYIVYPLIDESETLDYKDLMDGYDGITRDFPLPQFRVSVVHGRMKPADKEFEMQRFVSGVTHIMVATTVIEVGVDVPNASVMVIESAEKFGLSQLHQLRGRVGRGADQSYCILMSGYKLSDDAKTRLNTMVSTNDGFEIAETDLRLRGPGDLMGTMQSGIFEMKIADLVHDGAIVKYARDIAVETLKNDPNLDLSENQSSKIELRRIMKNRPNLMRIS